MKRFLILLCAFALSFGALAQDAMNTVPCRMDGADCAAVAGAVTSVGNGTVGSLFSASWATATTTPALSLNLAANVALAADTVPVALSLSGQSAYPQATVNTTGANLNLAGGLGRRFFTIVSNTALATKTVTLTANGTLVTLTASAGAPGANQFGPVGTDDTAPQILVTSTALATAISAHATLGPLMTASVVAGVVYLQKTPTLNTLAIATGTAGALVTATSGVDGGTAVLGTFSVKDAGGVSRFLIDTTGLGVSLVYPLTMANKPIAGVTSLTFTNGMTLYGGVYAKFVSGTGVGNSADTTNDALWTLTAIPANTFTANGDALVLTLSFGTAANGNNKQIGVTVGGAQVNSVVLNTNAGSGVLIVTITRVDATHVNTVMAAAIGPSTAFGSKDLNRAVSDLTTNTLAVVVTSASPTNSGAGDVLLYGGVAEFKK